MGNAASVVPSESDGGKKRKPTAQHRNDNKRDTPAPTAPRPRQSDKRRSTLKSAGNSTTTHDADKLHEAASPTRTIESVPEKAVDHRERKESIDRGGGIKGTPKNYRLQIDRKDSGLPQGRQSVGRRIEQKSGSDNEQQEQGSTGSGDRESRRGESREGTASEENATGSSGSGSYTTSSYTSGSEASGDDDASDDTFFIPEQKADDSLDEDAQFGGGGDDGGKRSGGVVIRVIRDGDREGSDVGRPRDEEKAQVEQAEKKKDESKSGKSKRKRPAKRHYIKDETMRTLFGLLPFYGGDGGSLDHMVKTTLASVGPNSIDVRNEAGDTLLIVACQYGCEDLVEPILAKGANPTAVNAVGICPLHYTCVTESLSFDATQALLWRGADPSIAETTYGCTPLHYAATSGDADICALLLENGAQPQTQDYYTYTAAHYAKSAGHEALVELLGGEGDGEGWLEVEEVYTGANATADEGALGPTGGLWIRHIDPQTELAYYMNDETGESWWESDLQTVAKDFLASVAADGLAGSKTGTVPQMTPLPPLGVREWLVQEQVRSWVVAIFSRADPLRLMEVELHMQMGKGDFNAMLKGLVSRYGLEELAFLRKASSPQLEPLGVSLLLPTEAELRNCGDDKPSPPALQGSECQLGQDTEGQRKIKISPDATPAAPIRRESSSASGIGEAVDLQPEGREGNASGMSKSNSTSGVRFPLQRVVSSQQCLKRLDSPTILRAEADKVFQAAVIQQENELAEERKRQADILEGQRKVKEGLEEMMQKRASALTKAKQEAEETSSAVAKLQLALADDSLGQAAGDALSEEIAELKAGVAAERVRLDHLTEALEITKGSAEERAEKQQAQEEDRRVRLEALRSQNQEEVTKIREEAAESLSKAEQAWETERVEMERQLNQKVEQETTNLKETVEGAVKTLSEAAATTKTATDAAKEGSGKVEEARAWMKDKAEAHANSKQIDLTNKQLHTNLRREMERAKQLHNQIEDLKGQTRIYARLRPMSAVEKEAGCKEVCVRDGKQTLALFTAQQQHWTYTQVFQIPSAESAATIAGHAELHREVAGLGTTLADGNNVLLLAVGAPRSGKTLALVGEPDEAAGGDGGGFFLPEDSGEDRGGTKAALNQGQKSRPAKRGKGKSGGEAENELGDGLEAAAKATPLAGVFPRLLAETFSILDHRDAQCAFVVWVSAAAVSIPAAPEAAGSRGCVVESLLPPVTPPPLECATASVEAGGENVEYACEKTKGEQERDPDLPPRPPPGGDGPWGRAVEASSPQEVMELVASARSRAVQPSATSAAPGALDMREDRHFLFRVWIELVNRSTGEASNCEMTIMELAEERPGEAWPAALAEIIRAHPAAASTNNKGSDADGFLGMVRSCLADTAKVVTVLCVSPADNHAEKTERVLSFGKACENSGEDGAAQLKDLKKELARLKKEAKGSKKTAPSQLPRPPRGN